MATLNPYLTFNGNCEEAFEFYKSVFGGEFIYLQRFGEIPGGENISENTRQKIMHIAFPVNNDTILMGSDASEEFGKLKKFGDNISLYFAAETAEEVTITFNKLAVDANITMPLDQTSWSPLFGMLTDKFGIHWMIGVEEPII